MPNHISLWIADGFKIQLITERIHERVQQNMNPREVIAFILFNNGYCLECGINNTFISHPIIIAKIAYNTEYKVYLHTTSGDQDSDCLPRGHSSDKDPCAMRRYSERMEIYSILYAADSWFDHIMPNKNKNDTVLPALQVQIVVTSREAKTNRYGILKHKTSITMPFNCEFSTLWECFLLFLHPKFLLLPVGDRAASAASALALRSSSCGSHCISPIA